MLLCYINIITLWSYNYILLHYITKIILCYFNAMVLCAVIMLHYCNFINCINIITSYIKLIMLYLCTFVM